MTEIKKIITKIQELQDLHGVDLEDPVARKAAQDVFLQKQKEVQKGINSIRDLIKKRNALVDRGGNRRLIIELNSNIRKEINSVITSFTELSKLMDKEMKKRRSKLTPDEKKFRQEIVQDLLQQLEEIKKSADEKVSKLDERDEDFMNDVGGTIEIRNVEDVIPPGVGVGFGSEPSSSNASSKEQKAPLLGKSAKNALIGGGSSNPFGEPGGGTIDAPTGGGGGPELTEEQKQGLAQIKQNDQELDEMVKQIGDGLDVLQDIATSMGDELKKQSDKLDRINDHMDKTQDKLDRNVKKAKETLETAQAEDRFCINLILIVVIIGVGVLIYNFVK